MRTDRSFLFRYRLLFGALLRGLAVSALLWIGVGCVFDTSGQAAKEYLARCQATVRGLDGAGTEFTVRSSDPEFSSHVLATWCVSPQGTDIPTEWAELLGDTLTGDFRGRPGPWCIDRGSASCDLGEPVDPILQCPSPASNSILEPCPAPPQPRCVQVLSLLDFGVVNVGESLTLPLSISNTCAEPIDVQVGESISGLQRDEFEVADNRCAAAPGDAFRTLAPAGSQGDQCDVYVAFLPISPLIRSAEYRFNEETTTVHVQLRGEGLGARATVSPDHALCLDGPLSGPQECTASKQWVITNPGPGGIRVILGELDPPGTGFQITTPPDGSFITTLQPATVEVEWCRALASGDTEQADYPLTLTSDTAANDFFVLEMRTPPCS